MSQSTSLYRTTKTRNARSQDQLRSSLLIHKQSIVKKSGPSPYHQTYGIPLPQPTIDLLTPVVSGLAEANAGINPEFRSLYTIGIWREDTSTIYRCCFIQPELASCTCSVPSAWKSTVENALDTVSSNLPGAMPCTLSTRTKLPQLSGRMTPYLVDALQFKVSWGFANVSG